MSRLQTRAKPYILALLKDEDVVLDADTQRTVASWAVMFSIVVSTKPGRDLIPETEKSRFKDTQVLNTKWRTWIGRYCGSIPEARRFIMSFAIVNEYDPPEPNGQTGFVQTTLVVGRCILQTLFVDPQEIYIDTIFYGMLRMLLPLAHWSVPILHPSSIRIADKDMHHVNHYLPEQIENELGDRLNKRKVTRY